MFHLIDEQVENLNAPCSELSQESYLRQLLAEKRVAESRLNNATKQTDIDAAIHSLNSVDVRIDAYFKEAKCNA